MPLAPAQIVWIIVCAAAVAGLLVAERRESARLRWAFKPAASAAFVLLALAGGALDSGFGRGVLAGLVLCALGDVLLIPKAKAAFLAGMGAFGLGHAAYALTFLAGGAAFGWPTALAMATMAVTAAASIRWLGPHLGSFRGPVVAYLVIISLMVVAAAAWWTAGGEAGRLVTLAAAGFALSDLSVARDRFISPAFGNRLWGLPLYYASQAAFALAAA